MGVVSLDQQEVALKVEVTPLEYEQLPEAEARADRGEEQRIMPSGMTLGCEKD